MGNGAASGSLIRNILFVKTGRHVSKQNINYMTKTVQQLQQDNDDSESNNLSGFATIMKKCEKKVRLHGTLSRSFDRIRPHQFYLLH